MNPEKPGYRDFAPALLAGGALWFLALMLRNSGIHIDENNYLDFAIHELFGDTRSEGKPPLFYVLNYGLYHGFAHWTGLDQPLVIYAVYGMLTVFSLVVLSASLARSRLAFYELFAIFLLTPLTIYNSTQLMMESLLLPLMSFALAALLCFLAQPDSRRTRAALLLATAAAVTLKPTAFPPLAVLTAALYPHLKKKAFWVLGGGVLGIAVMEFTIFLLHANAQGYAEFSNIVRVRLILNSLKIFPQLIYVWIFFLWPPLLASAYLGWRTTGRTRDMLQPRDRAFITVIFFSWTGSALMQLISNYPFARYHFPSIWMGIVCLAYFAQFTRGWVKLALLASFLVPDSALWTYSKNLFALWPNNITREYIYSGGTLFSGTPVYRWFLLSNEERKNLCVYFPKQGREGNGSFEQWLRAVAPGARLFDETQVPGFAACSGAHAVLIRNYGSESFYCSFDCPSSRYRFSGCSVQPTLYFTKENGGDLVNRTCLP